MSSARAAAPARRIGVDLARTAALVLMVIAHVAPGDGPGRILLVSEFLTAPLFALLVGAGAQLGEDGARPHRALRSLVRALCLIVVGAVLARSSAQVVIVLVHLGVLTALCIPLVRGRTRTLAGLLPLVLAAACLLPMLHRAALAGAGADTPIGALPVRALALAGGEGPYRLAAMAACALTGILLIRLLTSRPRGAGPVLLAGAGALGAFAALVIAPNLLGIFAVHAYGGTPAEITGDLAGAAGVLLLCWGAADLAPRALGLLALPGTMSLSLYTGQVVVLHAYSVLADGRRDDSWPMLLGLLLAGALLVALWRRFAARATTARGPLEGLVGLAESAALRLRSREGASAR
ncbi:hypothetical protein [Brachybacterium phenoliresistens]|uniref:hypothetical protein n=1 Tax=Brachybacterium phenoliresistens TaxID=396014 RepID=UPI0012EBBC9F|nr:hypothetical protein [Brachybacterium phenoliresistens]